MLSAKGPPQAAYPKLGTQTARTIGSAPRGGPKRALTLQEVRRPGTARRRARHVSQASQSSIGLLWAPAQRPLTSSSTRHRQRAADRPSAPRSRAPGRSTFVPKKMGCCATGSPVVRQLAQCIIGMPTNHSAGVVGVARRAPRRRSAEASVANEEIKHWDLILVMS